VLSPLLANVYLSELDKFMEDTLNANQQDSKKEINARITEEVKRIYRQTYQLRSWLKMGKKWITWHKREEAPILPEEERKQITTKLKTLEKERKKTQCLKTRPKMGFVRYADDCAP
jgi:hypothetical protein